MSRQSKRTIVSVEYQRNCTDSDRGSPVNKESKQVNSSVLFHVDSAPNVSMLATAGIIGDSPKHSPRLSSPKSRRDSPLCSQEALSASAATSGQELYCTSNAVDFRDGDGVESRLGSASERSEGLRHFGSPEKQLSTSEGCFSKCHSRSEAAFISDTNGLAASADLTTHSASAAAIFQGASDKRSDMDKKSDSLSDSTSEKDRSRTYSGNHHLRERSFEHSLDNILDKCSEKSLDLNLSVDSWNGTISEGGSRSADLTPMQKGSTVVNKTDKKKKGSWYTMLSPTYKSRSEDFKKTFKDVSKDERLIVDYSCAIQKDILVQGRMYISQNWVCFYANIFRWETVLMIPCSEITAITKEKTARVIPNAIQISTVSDKYFFTSFGARDKTYMMLFRIWQNVLMKQPMSPRELWQWVHYNYGDELGLTSSDDDYIRSVSLEDLQEKLKPEDDVQKDLTDSSDHPAPNDSLVVASNEDTDALVSDEVFNQSPSVSALPAATSPPTDYGDTSEDSDSEVQCTGHEHLEKLYLDEVFSLNVDKAFENIFTDSPFFRVFVGSRKTFELNLPPWQEEPDENGNRVRNISYTLTLNNSIGPRVSPSTEKQICYKDSKAGKWYCVDCECCNGGIPYGDSFYVVLRYCLTRVSLNKCRVRVTSQLKFRKSVMSMFKGMIEKSAVNGLTDYFRCFSAHLRREAERQEAHTHLHQPSKKKLRRRRKPHASVSDNIIQARNTVDRQTSSIPPSPVRGISLRDDGLIKLNADLLVRVIMLILIFLVLVNALLFYKLWAIEASTAGMYSMYTDLDIDNLVKHYRSQDDWAHLLRQQKSLHEDEVSKWKEILHTSVQLLDQMKMSLIALEKSLHLQHQSSVEPAQDTGQS